jgi:adenylosuccinate synthase
MQRLFLIQGIHPDRVSYSLHAYIVVDLGFGDSGKGILTDFLVRHFDAGVVVRYNGGAQAGHNVIAPDGRHHTFSQFGSGTFIPGVKTYLSRHVVFHPSAFLVEGNRLENIGLKDAFSRIRISDQALVTTPFHQAANRIREMTRAENRHGSCGVGVGETVEDALGNRADSILAGDLSNPSELRRKLISMRDRKRKKLVDLLKDQTPSQALALEWTIFEREDVIDRWISAISRIGELGLVVPDSVLQRWLWGAETVIFEGAQGVLLDAERGFHPHTTWSNCTTENALDLINESAPDCQVQKIGVIRSHAVRHGPGPLPTETDELAPFLSEHNQPNEWQGKVRYGWFDALLTRYALDATGGVDTLFVTHLDLLSHLKTWRCCTAYGRPLDFDPAFVDCDLSNAVLQNFRLPRYLPLAQRTQLTQALSEVTPIFETCHPDEQNVIQRIESLTRHPVGLISSGPSSEDVKLLAPLPL